MKTILFAGAVAALPLAVLGQVQAPGGPVAAPTAPVTAPVGAQVNTPASVPGFPAPATPVVNPAIPQVTPPAAVGRTFQTPPGFGGFPPARPIGEPANAAPALGVPPVVAPGKVAITNAGLASPFSTNVGGFVGSQGLGTVVPGPITEFAPPIVNPAGEPVAVDLPPGTIIRRPAPVPGVVGGPLPPPAQRFPNPTGTGAAPGPDRGTATSPTVVRPQR